MKTMLLILLSAWTFAQTPVIYLDKQNKHYLDSLHSLPSVQTRLSLNQVNYIPVMLADCTHYVLPYKILLDTNFNSVYRLIIGAGLSDSIRVVNLADSLFMRWDRETGNCLNCKK